MPAPAQTATGPVITPERQLKVDVARRAWISRLVDMSRRNNWLFYRDTKTGTLDLTGADADVVRLTALYNRFHDPDERDSGIQKLRDLQAAMDRSVPDASGWTDISTTCEFILHYECDEDEEAA
jgi:hypothetical protein